ncbi:MAG TPA: zinc ribbon domain-containing protein [Fodinibius sp.]|nr:zinc ribbon domain-containing protein [Fodinibius sp.]
MSNKKKECPGCAMMVDRDAEVCPICGYEFPKQSKGLQIMVWIMIILLVLYWVLW